MKHDARIIGLCGRAGSGKDTVASYLCNEHGYVAHALATPIRLMLEALMVEIGIDAAEYFHKSELKEVPIPGLGLSYRTMAQTLGTEWGRTLRPDLWLHLANIQLGLAGTPGSAPVHDRIVVTDVRFPNEAAWIHEHGGVVVHVNRQTKPVRLHESEEHIDSIRPYFVIDNSSTLIWMQSQVGFLLRDLDATRPTPSAV